MYKVLGNKLKLETNCSKIEENICKKFTLLTKYGTKLLKKYKKGIDTILIVLLIIVARI